MSRDNEGRIYIGNLPPDIRSKELEAEFDKFGKIGKIELKNGAGRGPPFAFIEFDDYRDAEDAVKSKNGSSFDGYSLRVEVPHSRDGGGRGFRGGDRPPRYDDRRGYGGGYDRGGYDRGGHDRGGYDRGYDRGYERDRGNRRNGRSRDRDNGSVGRERRKSSGSRRQWKVLVTGFPESTTVEELKKHMKDAGDVISADIKDDKGYIEFDNYDDMRYALKKIDGTDLETEKGDKSAIAVKESEAVRRSGSKSPSRRKRSASSSPKRRSRSRSRR